jgi:7,8-dihydro-6-hydroxymethylpterin-pyrophosphokinase
MGRARPADKNAARTIDFDIILLDGQCLDPDLWQRVHIALPVSELFPDYPSETGETLRETARRLALATPIHARTDIPLPFNLAG